MSAVATTQPAGMVETAPAPSQRGDLLLNEITQIEADLANLTPAAIASVHGVLESLLHEGGLSPATAAAARQLVREIAATRPRRHSKETLHRNQPFDRKRAARRLG